MKASDFAQLVEAGIKDAVWRAYEDFDNGHVPGDDDPEYMRVLHRMWTKAPDLMGAEVVDASAYNDGDVLAEIGMPETHGEAYQFTVRVVEVEVVK